MRNCSFFQSVRCARIKSVRITLKGVSECERMKLVVGDRKKKRSDRQNKEKFIV